MKVHRKVARTLPQEWRDVGTWPTPPEKAIRAEYVDAYKSRKRAIEAYVSGVSLKTICEDEAIDSGALYRLYESCIALNEDGKIKGFRAVIPYLRGKEYERKSPVNPDSLALGRGVSGLFSALLEKHSDFKDLIAAQAKKYAAVEWDWRRIPVGREHKEFLKVIARKMPLNGYPFNVVNQGREGYRKALHHAIDAVRGREATGHKSSKSRDFTSSATDFFRCVQIDAHRLDKAVPVKFIGRKGRFRIKLLRPWLLAGVECESTACLGWHLSFDEQPSEFDLLCCFYNMMAPWEPRETFEIDGLQYEEGAGMPSGLLENCRCRYADTNELDNALPHHANNLRTVALTMLHATLKLGLPRLPETRTEIEQLFNTLTHQNIQHLVGGLRPDMSNRERKGAMKQSERFGMTPDQMEEYLDVVICNRNGHPSSALYSKSPLEYLSEEDLDAIIRSDSSKSASWRNLLQIELEIPVRASGGHLPHINYEGASYTNDMLKVAQHLVNAKIIVTINLMDMTCCEAHTTDGKLLGTLMVEPRWQFPHDYRLRKKLNAAINDGRFFWVPSKTPEQCVKEFLASGGKKSPAPVPTMPIGKTPRAKPLSPPVPRTIADVAAGAEFDLQKILGKKLKG